MRRFAIVYLSWELNAPLELEGAKLPLYKVAD